MYIVPMNSITGIEGLKDKGNTVNRTESGFKDIFKDALQNVVNTQKVCEEDNIKVALGDVDNLHEIQINSQKASLALETFVSMKNTAVDAFNELMRISI